MTSVLLADILKAVEATLATAPTLARSMAYDALTEGMQDTPALEVYPESGEEDTTSNTDRTTFRAGVRQTNLVIHCDYYAHQRANIAEDMSALVSGIDAMTAVFEAQDKKPYFGLEGIKAFHWSWQRVIFNRGDPAINYIGARFRLDLRVF